MKNKSLSAGPQRSFWRYSMLVIASLVLVCHGWGQSYQFRRVPFGVAFASSNAFRIYDTNFNIMTNRFEDLNGLTNAVLRSDMFIQPGQTSTAQIQAAINAAIKTKKQLQWIP